MEKEKKQVSDFLTVSIDDMDAKKKLTLVCWYNNTQQ